MPFSCFAPSFIPLLTLPGEEQPFGSDSAKVDLLGSSVNKTPHNQISIVKVKVPENRAKKSGVSLLLLQCAIYI